MSRYDDWDYKRDSGRPREDNYGARGYDEPRRRGYEDYDDYGYRRDLGRNIGRGGSGMTIALGVVDLVFGGLALLLGICLFFGFIVETTERFGGRNPLIALLLMVSVGVLSAGVAGVVGGIGTLLRRRWGWVLGIITAGLSALLTIMFVILLVRALNLPPFSPEKGTMIVANLFGIVFTIGYTTFTFIGSFQASVRADVR